MGVWKMKKFGFNCISLGLVTGLLFSLAACGGTGEPAAESESRDAVPAVAESATAMETDPTTPATEQETGVPTTEAETQPALPSTKAEILELYTEAMNKAKSGKPAYHKVEYQEITEKNFDGKAVNTVLSLASKFMTTPEKATKNPEIHEKGADTTYFPVYEGSAGCLIAPEKAEEAIESASCKELGDGNYEIVITLNEETDPEPLESYHGQMFSPISRKVIDGELEKLSVVKTEYYSILYHDCTATLVVNPETLEIVSLYQRMYCLITAKGAIDMGIIHFDIDGNATLQNTLQITDFQY